MATNTPPKAEDKKGSAPVEPKLKAPEGFELLNWTFPSKIDAGKFGVIDLEKLTPRRAQKLVDKKFPYLRKSK